MPDQKSPSKFCTKCSREAEQYNGCGPNVKEVKDVETINVTNFKKIEANQMLKAVAAI